MAHWAEIDDTNTVVRVLVAEDDSHDWLVNRLGGRWVQTSYNTRGGVHSEGGTALRFNYAGIGYTYDEARDAFIPPKPTEDATLDEATCTWIVPEPSV
jgi:hypothetical protein